MNTITQLLFWVSNSFLIPDILLLLLLFVRALLLSGNFYNSFVVGKKVRSTLGKVQELTVDQLKGKVAQLPSDERSMLARYLRELTNRLEVNEDYTNYLLSQFENEAEKDLSLSRMLTKLGPVLGLIGTLISMGPALVGLSSGDISSMAYNMQIVFATTVVGLLISLVGLVTLQYKQRWYAQDVAALEYLSSLYLNPHSSDK